MPIKERKKTSIIWTTDKKEFAKIIANSRSYTEALSYFNMVNKGGNHKTIKNRILKEGLSTKHFVIYTGNKATAKSITDVLVENSNYSRNQLKKRIIKLQLIRYKCDECGIRDKWNNKPISLCLDHINGVHNDNRLENLRFLCPNCHSQTHTFAGKKCRGNRYYSNYKSEYYKDNRCVDCNIEISGYSKRCRKCRGKLDRKIDRPSKNILLSDIKELGYVGTGKKYGVSDNCIRKWLKVEQST